MKDLIVDALKKQLIKLAIGGVVVAAVLGFRIYQVSGDPDAAYQEAVEQELAASEATTETGQGVDEEDQVSDSESIWSFSSGSNDEESVASNRAIPCYIDGNTQFMLQQDCVTRGGMPTR